MTHFSHLPIIPEYIVSSLQFPSVFGIILPFSFNKILHLLYLFIPANFFNFLTNMKVSWFFVIHLILWTCSHSIFIVILIFFSLFYYIGLCFMVLYSLLLSMFAISHQSYMVSFFIELMCFQFHLILKSLEHLKLAVFSIKDFEWKSGLNNLTQFLWYKNLLLSFF